MGRDGVYPVKTSKVGYLLQYDIAYLDYDIVKKTTDLGHPYWIYRIYCISPRSLGMQQWLLLQFLVLLMMDAESVRNM